MATTTPKSCAPFSKGDYVTAIKLASPIVLALKECDPKLRETAIELFEQLQSGELDVEQAYATTALIAEILFPNADHDGMLGLDLEEAEKIAADKDPAAGAIFSEMDKEEATFAESLGRIMGQKGVTQAALADKIGIGQPAISMMLSRTCRPQRKTVRKIADALGVDAEELWPTKPKGH